MEKRMIAWTAAFLAGTLSLERESAAQSPCCPAATAATCPVPAACKEVDQTVLVPTFVTEARKICVPEYRIEQRQRICTVCRPVFETKNVQVTCCVPVPQWRTRTEKCLVRKPVTRQVTQEYAVADCKPGCTPEIRTRKVAVCDFVMEEQSREVKYLVCVPQMRTQTIPVTTLVRVIPEQRAITCAVMIPFMAEREVQVQVCKYVPKTIKVKLPAQASCNAVPAATCRT